MAKLLSGTRIYGTATIDTQLLINGTASATSTVTGALQVIGGVGIGGSLYAGNIYSNGTLVTGGGSSTGTTSTFVISNTTAATSTNSGALQVVGGIGVGGSVYSGGSIYATTEIAIAGSNFVSFGGQASSTRIKRDGGLNGLDLQTSNLSRLFIADTDGAVTIRSTATSTSTTTGALIVTGGVGVGGRVNINSTLTVGGNVGINNITPGSALDVKGTLRLSGSTSGYVGISPAAVAGSTTYTLPSADGTSGQLLQTNGTATLSWTTASGATITNDTTTNTTQYLGMSRVNTGSWATAYVADSKLYFNPSSGTLNSTIFNSLSDISRKNNIHTITNAVNTVNNIEGVEFAWEDNGKKSAGVVAQQLEQVLPWLVDTAEDGLKSVNYNGIIGYLINAVKELDARVQDLENR